MRLESSSKRRLRSNGLSSKFERRNRKKKLKEMKKKHTPHRL